MTAELAPLTMLKGVGPGIAARLAALHLHTLQDLLFHLPLRYQDRTRISPIAACRIGSELLLEGEVLGCEISFGRRRSLLCRIKDGTGLITLRFYHFSAAQKSALAPGTRVRCYGEVRGGTTGLELYHPEYQVLKTQESPPLEARLTPVYPVTEGLQQTRLRALVDQALNLLDSQLQLTDWLPAPLRQALGFASLAEALQFLHRPPVSARLHETLHSLANGQHPAQRRLAFEELLSHRLCLRRLRQQADQQSAPLLRAPGTLRAAFLRSLPFALTGAQQRVAQEIAADLGRERPMLRLLQGDVGSGKTLIAALAALQAVESGLQAAIMAPTELLAEQHHLNFTRWLEPLGLKVGWLSGKLKGRQREGQLQAMSNGEAQVVVGTHALFQAQVQFARLGLIVIDEQHRFGVHQRLALREKGASGQQVPHQLVMTATPIPRTLAMSAYADLDCSVIDELPPGRTPVNTLVISSARRAEIIARIHHACSQGAQAYWVCTLIEDSEALQCQAAQASAQALRQQLPDLAIGLVHGRMKPREKSAVMDAFKAGELKLLVATTVIEVGVDVPNASLMIIENPERLGLAQLHQLRGRVGRGAVASHCVLLYQAPLSALAQERLGIMRDSTDGFLIAEKDLALRGPGQVLGTAQTGLMSFRIADLVRDAGMLEQVREHAEILLQDHPAHVEPLIRRWLGERELYGNV
jgi:ATP-dependent DNA helicase RecG